MKYKDSGVNIDEGNKFIEMIKPLAKTTIREGVLNGIGGFGALMEIKNYKKPVLVSGTDGVGTKLKIAFMMNKHDTIGIDLVAMCVNDIVVSGAEPLFFLDYFATGKLISEVGVEVVRGITEGCRQAGCALIGGETAELPGMYNDGEYDLAGFAVGIVEKDAIITGEGIKEGDVLLGLKSSGIHSNGYSLVRKVLFDKNKMSVDDYVAELGTTLGDVLLTPTRIYVNSIKALKGLSIKGIAHITGGGFLENIPRIFKEGISAKIKKDSWEIPEIFKFLQKMGDIEDTEMYRTFNMGIGMVLVLAPEDAQEAIDRFKKAGDTSYIIGEITKGNKGVII
ncbi:MAG: phosphoribosylformylglycinamidine cyclo-ligase [Thermoanaerobacteraceae bacterium]|nr:phosphoribosylformylglycinamidine cyclo-ligase [Thermoanaerobacteraceae bacterium]